MTMTPTGSALQRVLDGEFHDIKQRWREEITADDIVRDPALTLDEARDWTLDRVKRLAHRHFVTAGCESLYSLPGHLGPVLRTRTD